MGLPSPPLLIRGQDECAPESLSALPSAVASFPSLQSLLLSSRIPALVFNNEAAHLVAACRWGGVWGGKGGGGEGEALQAVSRTTHVGEGEGRLVAE